VSLGSSQPDDDSRSTLWHRFARGPGVAHDPHSAVAVEVIPLAVSTVDLARIQFATTSLYHFLFVPLRARLTGQPPS
jgi:hypothetical protein